MALLAGCCEAPRHWKCLGLPCQPRCMAWTEGAGVSVAWTLLLSPLSRVAAERGGTCRFLNFSSLRWNSVWLIEACRHCIWWWTGMCPPGCGPMPPVVRPAAPRSLAQLPALRPLVVAWKLRPSALSRRGRVFENAECFILSDESNGAADKVEWPRRLERLFLGGAFNCSLDSVSWPASLRELMFSDNGEKKVEDLVNQPIDSAA